MKTISYSTLVGFLSATALYSTGILADSIGASHAAFTVKAVSQSIATTTHYDRDSSASGFKWGAESRSSGQDEEQWAKSQPAQTGFKWSNEIPNQPRSLAISESYEFSNSHHPEQTGFKWGVRSYADQAGFKWGVRNYADQAGFKWGVRNYADQTGFKWGVRSHSDQAGFKWGVRNYADQAGFKWGVRNYVEQTGFKWGVRNFADQAGFKWGVR